MSVLLRALPFITNAPHGGGGGGDVGHLYPLNSYNKPFISILFTSKTKIYLMWIGLHA